MADDDDTEGVPFPSDPDEPLIDGLDYDDEPEDDDEFDPNTPKFMVRLSMNSNKDTASESVLAFVDSMIDAGLRRWIYSVEVFGTNERVGWYDGYGTEVDINTIIYPDREVLVAPDEPMSEVPLEDATPQEAAAGLPEDHLDDAAELLAFAEGMPNALKDEPES